MPYTLTEKDGIKLIVDGPNLDISVDASEIAQDILNALKTVDGTGSGLDADLLDGQQGTHYLARASHTGTQLASTISDFNTAANARIDARVTKAFVDNLGINATQLQGNNGAHYLARANHTGTQLASTISDFSTATNGLIDTRVNKSFVDTLGINAVQLEGENKAYYRGRANHTGTQLASTISDFNTAADARVNTLVPQIVTANFVNQLNVNADTVSNLTATQLLARANHTGTQTVSTLSDYTTATDTRIDNRVTKTFVDNLNINAATLNAQNAAYYLSRANHSGTQTTATISDFGTQVDSKIDTRVNKAFVDALNVDADTLDSLDSTYLLARENHTGFQDGTTVTYDPTGHDLVSTNMQAAIDELDFKKADVASLSSNIILYSTTAASNVPPYNKLVTDTNDPDYDEPAVEVATGAVTGQNQLVAAFISEPSVIIGNPGIISITTVGSLRRISGNDGANFYFTISKRDSAGNEVVLGTSGNTPVVNEPNFKQFAEYAILNNGLFVDTDRIVIKYFANRVGNTTAGNFEIRVGGSDPVRTLLPVPVSVIPAENASGIIAATANFNGILSGADDTVQKALDTIDNHTHLASAITDFSTATAGVVTKAFVEALNVELAALKATGATAGHVLTANGTGGATWQNALANVGIQDLNDVNYSFGPPVQGDQLIYNETTSTWQPQTPVGSGDMLKSTYDQNFNNIVDRAETLNDGNVEVFAQEVRDIIDSDPVGQALVFSIAFS